MLILKGGKEWFTVEKLNRFPMRVTFPRNDDDDANSKRKEPDWVLDLSSRLTQKYIHKRCLQLINDGRYEDVKAIQDEFIVEDT